MGLELIFGAISAVVGIFGAVAQAGAAREAAEAQKEAAAQQREANTIEKAGNQNIATESRRQKIRETRIRRAQIIAASENQGTSASSGQVGAVGALSTNLAGTLGVSLGQGAAATGINNAQQSSADWIGRANEANQRGATIGAWTNTIQQGIGGFQSIFDKKSTG